MVKPVPLDEALAPRVDGALLVERREREDCREDRGEARAARRAAAAVGAVWPHAWMAPWSSSAANAYNVEKMAVKPVPLGAPLPPWRCRPTRGCGPGRRAPRTRSVEKMAVKPVPLGAPLPPAQPTPHAWMRPWSSSATRAARRAAAAAAPRVDGALVVERRERLIRRGDRGEARAARRAAALPGPTRGWRPARRAPRTPRSASRRSP